MSNCQYRENPSNHELLTVRGVDCRALLKIFGGPVTLYPTVSRHEMICWYVWTLERDEAPEHFFPHTAITSPHCQEFMV